MTIQNEFEPLPEVVAIFHTAEQLEAAIDELLRSGFDRAELSLLASAQAVEKKLGRHYARVGALADDREVPRTDYVSTAAIGDAEGALIGGLTYVGATAAIGGVVASGGALGLAIAAAALAGGAGGLIGLSLARHVGYAHAHYLEEQIERGGLLLWVRLLDPMDEARAVNILRNHAGDDVHVHGRLTPA